MLEIISNSAAVVGQRSMKCPAMRQREQRRGGILFGFCGVVMLETRSINRFNFIDYRDLQHQVSKLNVVELF